MPSEAPLSQDCPGISKVRALLGMPSAPAVLRPVALPMTQREFPLLGEAADDGVDQGPFAVDPGWPPEDPVAISTTLGIPGFSVPKTSPSLEPVQALSEGFADSALDVLPPPRAPHVELSTPEEIRQPAPSPREDADFFGHLQRVVSALSGQAKSELAATPSPSPARETVEKTSLPGAGLTEPPTQPKEAIRLAALPHLDQPIKPSQSEDLPLPGASKEPELSTPWQTEATRGPDPTTQSSPPASRPAAEAVGRFDDSPASNPSGVAQGSLAAEPGSPTEGPVAVSTTLGIPGFSVRKASPSLEPIHAEGFAGSAQGVLPPPGAPPVKLSTPQEIGQPAPNPREDADFSGDSQRAVSALSGQAKPELAATPGPSLARETVERPSLPGAGLTETPAQPKDVVRLAALHPLAQSVKPSQGERTLLPRASKEPELSARWQTEVTREPNPTTPSRSPASRPAADAVAHIAELPASNPSRLSPFPLPIAVFDPAPQAGLASDLRGSELSSKVSTPPRSGRAPAVGAAPRLQPAPMPLLHARPAASDQPAAETRAEIWRLRSELADLAEQLKAQQAKQKEAAKTPPAKTVRNAPAIGVSSAFWERRYVGRLYGWNRG